MPTPWQLERQTDWTRMESLLKETRFQVDRLSLKELKELSTLYRGLVNDLAKAQTLDHYTYLVPYLNQMAQQAHARLHARKNIQSREIWQYIWHDFPDCVRRNWYFILAGFLAFALGSAISMTLVYLEPSTARYFLPLEILDQLEQGKIWTESMDAAPNEATFLMTNNIRVSFMAFGAGLILGIGTLFIMFSNGMQAFGGPLQACINEGVGHKLILFMIPHGVIELFTIFIAGAAGMMLGIGLLFPGSVSRWEALKSRSKDALILISGCVPLLIIAGLIEGLVSLNGSLPDWFRIAVSVTSVILLTAYLTLSGQKQKQPKLKTPL
jgi:uncharacterized membrane protein SpoIIM required for sporulation